MKYALINKSDGSLVKKAKWLPTIDNTVPKDLDPSLAWLIVREDRPAFDKATHRLEKLSEALLRGEWVISFTPVPLTSEVLRATIKDSFRETYEAGFQFKGASFSLKDIAVYNGTYMAKEFLTYPRGVTSLDGTVVSLANPREVSAFWAAGVAQYESIANEEQDELKQIK